MTNSPSHRPTPPPMTDEDHILGRRIFFGAVVIMLVLLVSLALPSIRDLMQGG